MTYLRLLRERIFEKVVEELRLKFDRPSTAEIPVSNIEIEMIWALHASIFYLGVRHFIYHMPPLSSVDSIIEAKIATLLGGVASILPASAAPDDFRKPVDPKA